MPWVIMALNITIFPCYLYQGEMRPDAATGILVMFETKFNRLKEDRDNLMKAKDALELLDTGVCGSNGVQLGYVCDSS